MDRTLAVLAATAVLGLVAGPAHAETWQDPKQVYPAFGPMPEQVMIVPSPDADPDDLALVPGPGHVYDVTYKPIRNGFSECRFRNVMCPLIEVDGQQQQIWAEENFVPAGDGLPVFDQPMKTGGGSGFNEFRETLPSDTPYDPGVDVRDVWASDRTKVDPATGGTYRLVAWSMDKAWVPEWDLEPRKVEPYVPPVFDTPAPEPEPAAAEETIPAQAKATVKKIDTAANSEPVDGDESYALWALGGAGLLTWAGARRGRRARKEQE